MPDLRQRPPDNLGPIRIIRHGPPTLEGQENQDEQQSTTPAQPQLADAPSTHADQGPPSHSPLNLGIAQSRPHSHSSSIFPTHNIFPAPLLPSQNTAAFQIDLERRLSNQHNVSRPVSTTSSNSVSSYYSTNPFLRHAEFNIDNPFDIQNNEPLSLIDPIPDTYNTQPARNVTFPFSANRLPILPSPRNPLTNPFSPRYISNSLPIDVHQPPVHTRAIPGIPPTSATGPVNVPYATEEPVPQMVPSRTIPVPTATLVPVPYQQQEQVHRSLSALPVTLPTPFQGSPHVHHPTPFQGSPHGIHQSPHLQQPQPRNLVDAMAQVSLGSFSPPALDLHGLHPNASTPTHAPPVLSHSAPLVSPRVTTLPNAYGIPVVSSAAISAALTEIKKVDALTPKNFKQWFARMQAPLVHLELLGHICQPPLPGTYLTHINTPVYSPPFPGHGATLEEIQNYKNFRANDHAVWQILTSRIDNDSLAFLPGPVTDGRETTARELFDVIQRNWGINDGLAILKLQDELFETSANTVDEVESYIANYRRQLSVLSPMGAVDWPTFLRRFAQGLPKNHWFSPTILGIINLAHQARDHTSFELAVHSVMDVVTVYKTTYKSSSKTSTRQPSSKPAPQVRCSGCNGRGRKWADCNNCKKEGRDANGNITNPKPTTTQTTTTTNTYVPPSSKQPAKANVVVAEPTVTLSQSRTIDAYGCSVIESPDILLPDSSSSNVHPIKSLTSDNPDAAFTLMRSGTVVLDSACTRHIINRLEYFVSFDDNSETDVMFAGGSDMTIRGSGMCVIEVTAEGLGEKVHVRLHNCLFCLSSPFNLISEGALMEAGFALSFTKEKHTLLFPPDNSGQRSSWPVDYCHRLLFLHGHFVNPHGPSPTIPSSTPPSLDIACFTFDKVEDSADVIHRHLCHIGESRVRQLLAGDFVKGLKWNGKHMSPMCAPCIEGKGIRSPYNHHMNRASLPLELLVSDTCGPMPVRAPSGALYFHVLLCDNTNLNSVVTFARKSDARKHVKATVARWENHPNARKHKWKVVYWRHDGAKEFIEEDLDDWLNERGISHQTTAPYAHSQNGKAERFIRTLEEGMQVLLADSGLPMQFWEDAVLTVAYILNFVPTKTLPANTTPYEAFTGEKPDVSHLRIWGCQCWVLIPSEIRPKGGFRYREGIFVGYKEGTVGWRVRDVTGKYWVSRDVIFNETRYGKLGTARHRVQEFSLPAPTADTSIPLNPITTSPPMLDIPTATLVDIEAIPSISISAGPSTDVSSGAVTPSEVSLRRSSRTRNTTRIGEEWQAGIRARDERRQALIQRRARTSVDAGTLNDIVAITLADSYLVQSMIMSIQDLAPSYSEAADYVCLMTPLSFPDKAWLPPRRVARKTPFNLQMPPNTLREAIERPDSDGWNAAMQVELGRLLEMGVFEPVEKLPEGRVPLRLKWVYDYKRDAVGNVNLDAKKGRLVVMGNTQRPEDYSITEAPVVKIDVVRWMLGFAATHDYELSTFDFSTAFLNATLSDEVYVAQVPGFEDSRFPWKFYKLCKALYGLKQSAYEWWKELSDFLIELGFVVCPADRCFFIGKWTAAERPDVPLPAPLSFHHLMVCLHVDDGLNAHNSLAIYEWLIVQLRRKYKVTDNGSASTFLGLRIERDRAAKLLWISQPAYVEELLETYGMTEASKTVVPLHHKAHEILDTISTDRDIPSNAQALQKFYQRLIGSLLWLAVMTRPDIAFAIMSLSQYNTKPTPALAMAAKGVLRYLAGTRTLSLQYGGVQHSDSVAPLTDIAYTDADWASDEQDRRSISGFAVFANGGLVSWSSSKQKTIALSSTESEYVALTHCIRHLLWLRTFTSLVGYPLAVPFPVLSDNQASMKIAEGYSISGNTKHIDIKLHFIRSHIHDGTFMLKWVPTLHQVADIFTKPLDRVLHGQHKTTLGMVSR